MREGVMISDRKDPLGMMGEGRSIIMPFVVRNLREASCLVIYFAKHINFAKEEHVNKRKSACVK